MHPNQPLVTVGILSWSRLHYLKATVESARTCIQYPSLEWILSDNNSEEPGVRTYIDSLDWVQHKVFKRQSHAAAMNQIVEMASGDFIMLLPDDAQFVVKGDWLWDMVELLDRHDWIGSITLDFMSRRRNHRHFARGPLSELHDLVRHGRNWRRPRRVKSSRGYGLRTLGNQLPGIAPAGILSLTRKAVWQELGPWRETIGVSSNIIDSSLGAEDDMFVRFVKSGLPLQRAHPLLPVAASIFTDPTGTTAKMRGQHRYGIYKAPEEGNLYYEIRTQKELSSVVDGRMPLSFEDWVRSLWGGLPLDEEGQLIKGTINTDVVERVGR